jgi:hypothetical protein
VVAAPGEPRGGYSRTYRELAGVLALEGIATLVVDVDLDGNVGMVDRWRGRVTCAHWCASANGLRIVLTVARSLSWAAVGGTETEVALVSPCRGPWDEDMGVDEDVRVWGFEEVWGGSCVPAAVARRVAEARVPTPNRVTVITNAEHNPGLWWSPMPAIRSPASVTDPLFRRVWERSWLVATLSALVPRG